LNDAKVLNKFNISIVWIKIYIFVAQKNKNNSNMAQVAGIIIDRTHNGIPTFAHIDLRKHIEFIPLLKKKGLEIESSVKWTKKMKHALAETEFKKGNINNFWDE
jgi:hypothetical protein